MALRRRRFPIVLAIACSVWGLLAGGLHDPVSAAVAGQTDVAGPRPLGPTMPIDRTPIGSKTVDSRSPGAVDNGPATPGGDRLKSTSDENRALHLDSPKIPLLGVGRARHSMRSGGTTILQIGDSHTAGDYFTDAVRKILQRRFGDGGLGYIDAGKPHPGVRYAALGVVASPGWTYSALQKSEDGSGFDLSGFDATASHAGESLSFTAPSPVPYDRIEIEFATGPDLGTMNIRLDDLPAIRQVSASALRQHIVLVITPDYNRPAYLRRLTLTSVDGRPIVVSSVGIFNKKHGVSYSNIGFPGATIDIVNKIDPVTLHDDLTRINPQIVVLSFGTNEGFNDALNIEQYKERYLNVIHKIRGSLPNVKLVMIGPPLANRVPAGCLKTAGSQGCKTVETALQKGHDGSCEFPTPPKLDMVREAQRSIAKNESITFWDWSSIMPHPCGPDAWVNANPRLMTPDHVHFTAAGYRLGAKDFASVIIPIVSQIRRPDYAFSHN